jgi:hypothetical protein
MMVVGATPNTAGTQNEYSKNPHQPLRQTRVRQYGLVLLIMINDKKPKVQQPGEKTAYDAAQKVKVPQGPSLRARQQNCSG